MSENPFRIFVVEDNDWYNRLLVHTLELNPDYEVESFVTGQECLGNLYKNPDLVTLDYRLPDMSGLEVLHRIKQEHPGVKVILISEQEDIEVAVDLLKDGAYDYLVKTEDIKDRLLNTVKNIIENIGLKREISELRREVQKKYHKDNSIIGESPAMKKVHELIGKALTTNINISLSGETGTGKELVAKAIHYNSDRKSNPFLAVNVSAIPSELIESELFGHEKGAFTGAVHLRKGKFEDAKGGTLFLDEIGEMDLSFQPKLLRVLQEKEFVRVGSNRAVQADCRIITATNKNLAREVKEGRFRQDLYYRLQGLPIELPPLRERDKDVLILAKHFIQDFCAENNIPLKKLSVSARKRILQYPFPGNVRELKSLVELAVTLSDNIEISAEELLLEGEDFMGDMLHEGLTMREFHRKIVFSFLRKNNNDISLAAKKLDIGKATIYRILKEARDEGQGFSK